jgi:phospholipase C
MGERINRRGALKAGLVAGTLAGTGAWRMAPGTGQPLRRPGSLPYPKLSAGTDTISQIEHIVVLMMENHSYDNYLGMLDRPGADGFKLKKGMPTATNPYPNGQIDDTTPATTDYPANGTIFDQFDAHGITWKDYIASAVPTSSSLALFPKLYLNNATTKIVLNTEFFTDAAAGTLPNFSLVEPDYGNQSEENPQNIAVGEQFAASVINAVINGPAWDRTMLLLTYDEHGGYFDHVPPPAAVPPDSIGPTLVPGENGFDGFARYGFRVPFALVSPWARMNFVSHRVYDHTSILKLVETKWNLPALTYRDANATAMLDLLDLHHPAFATPPKLAEPLATADPSALSCSVSGPGTIPAPASVTG